MANAYPNLNNWLNDNKLHLSIEKAYIRPIQFLHLIKQHVVDYEIDVKIENRRGIL
jgi:hypothetical protein